MNPSLFDPTPGQVEKITSDYNARMKSRLQDMVWDAMDELGDPMCSSTAKYSDAEMAAYAAGIKNIIWGIAERCEVEVCTRQIDAALGERLRRVNSKQQKLRSRRLNNILDAIRDQRIAMRDKYVTLEYSGVFKPLRSKLWKIQNQAIKHGWSYEGECEDYHKVERELDALFGLNGLLIGDDGWLKKHMELHHRKPEAVAA